MPRHIHSDFKENTAVGGIDAQDFYQCFSCKAIGEIQIPYSIKEKKKDAGEWKTKKKKGRG